MMGKIRESLICFVWITSLDELVTSCESMIRSEGICNDALLHVGIVPFASIFRSFWISDRMYWALMHLLLVFWSIGILLMRSGMYSSVCCILHWCCICCNCMRCKRSPRGCFDDILCIDVIGDETLRWSSCASNL